LLHNVQGLSFQAKARTFTLSDNPTSWQNLPNY
jgi:hypothetical protein